MTNREYLMQFINQMSDDQLKEIIYDWCIPMVCKSCKMKVNGKCPLPKDENCENDDVSWLSEEIK